MEQKRINNDNLQIELALQIAVSMHDGQVDLDGKPTILHALAVGMAGENALEQCVGFLHDVVEDTDLTFESLQRVVRICGNKDDTNIRVNRLKRLCQQKPGHIRHFYIQKCRVDIMMTRKGQGVICSVK